MKNIEYRAWDSYKKIMVYEDQNIKHIYPEMRLGDIIPIKVYSIGRAYKNSLMQYTGMKDSKGRKIFEGDILRDENEDMGKVFFDCGCFLIDLENEEDMTLFGHNPEEYLEVVGNIFENSELLSEEKK